MKDPFFIGPIPWLSQIVQPLSDWLDLPTLPLHIHEIVFGLILYTAIYYPISPLLSSWLFPVHYPQLNRRTKINWDAHVVSLVQSSLINVLALWVLRTDDELWNMSRDERVWGYTGAAGMIQALVAGYFLWDLVMAVMHFPVFGPGALAHAVCALTVYIVGYRPFINYYSPIFILWELSTPFLNFHWFMDKIKMTGSTLQLYNGMMLLGTFFCVRLVWGTYQSSRVIRDMWYSLDASPNIALALAEAKASGDQAVILIPETMRFVTDATRASASAAGAVMVANMTLNSLNYYWFVKMIDAVRKRFPKTGKVDQKSSRCADSSGDVVTVQGTGLANTVVVDDGVDNNQTRHRKA
jgi:hypothetical protein